MDDLYPGRPGPGAGRTETATADSFDEISLAPHAPGLAEAMKHEIADLSERVVVESVRLFPLNSESRANTAEEELIVANILRRIETMEGIEYYSQRRETMRTLFKRSFRIADVDRPEERVSDSSIATVPDHEQFHVLQEDLTFGENVYRFDYRRLDGSLLLAMRNMNRLSYGILPAIGAERLRIVVIALPVEEGILFYAFSAVNVRALFGMQSRIAASFENRVNALADWFDSMVEEHLRVLTRN